MTSKKPTKTESSRGTTNTRNTQQSMFPLILKWMLRIAAALVSLVSLLTLQQFLTETPEITPVDFSARDPFFPEFKLHNPMHVSMYGVQIASKPGPSEIGNVANDPGFYEAVGGAIVKSCQELIGADSFDDLAADNQLIRTQAFDEIEPGADLTFKSGLSIKVSTHYMLIFAYRYRIRMFGVIPLWNKSQCRVFETQRDTEGRVHMIPYKQASQKR